MTRCICAAILAAVVLGLTASASAVTYYAGLRWDDTPRPPLPNDDCSTIALWPGETATLEMFATTTDAASTNEFLFYLSDSTGPADGLTASSIGCIEDWTYDGSFAGPPWDWYSHASGDRINWTDELCLDLIEITVALEMVPPYEWILKPAAMFDVILNDCNDPAADTYLLDDFECVRIVPEAATLSLLGLGGLAGLRRRRRDDLFQSK